MKLYKSKNPIIGYSFTQKKKNNKNVYSTFQMLYSGRRSNLFVYFASYCVFINNFNMSNKKFSFCIFFCFNAYAKVVVRTAVKCVISKIRQRCVTL